jgi:hypothetical protein
MDSSTRVFPGYLSLLSTLGIVPPGKDIKTFIKTCLAGHYSIHISLCFLPDHQEIRKEKCGDLGATASCISQSLIFSMMCLLMGEKIRIGDEGRNGGLGRFQLPGHKCWNRHKERPKWLWDLWDKDCYVHQSSHSSTVLVSWEWDWLARLKDGYERRLSISWPPREMREIVGRCVRKYATNNWLTFPNNKNWKWIVKRSSLISQWLLFSWKTRLFLES